MERGEISSTANGGDCSGDAGAFGRIERGQRQALLLLEQLEKDLLGLFLPFQKLAVQGRGLFGQSLQGEQIVLRVRECQRQCRLRRVDALERRPDGDRRSDLSAPSRWATACDGAWPLE